MGLYAGDISALRAWEMLKDEKGATLVDVRTVEEWQTIGKPDLADLGKNVVYLSWRKNPGYELNHDFIPNLQSQVKDKNQKVFFMCKGGGRSREAAIAMTQLGYSQAYNIENGFEADGGWKSSQLPWGQK